MTQREKKEKSKTHDRKEKTKHMYEIYVTRMNKEERKENTS
jgi:hypothetical protein